MSAVSIGVVILVAVLVLWLALETSQGRHKAEALESQMNELRRDLQTIATSQASSTGQLETIAKSVAQRHLAGRHQELRPDYRPDDFRCANQDGRRTQEHPRSDQPNSAAARRSAASRETDVPDRADPRRHFGRR